MNREAQTVPEHQRRQNGLNSAASHAGSPVENSPDDRNLSHGADVGPAKPVEILSP